MFKDIDIKFVNKEITPFGGLSLFFKMLEKCGFEQELQACGLPEQGSNRGYKPWQLIYGLFAGVWCGACKFGHLDLVRYDRVLSKMVGWDPGPGNIPNEEPEVFFYHSDHLGSASWITGGDGKPIQHLQYLPFGEPFINQRISGYNERYTFTGKERDEETGYGYFGARYMDYELMTMWLSVDPMADKYPGISPYAYCAWSPIIAKDPNGMDSVRTPNGMANVGKGYKTTPDGMYLYGEGLQTKKWNPNLEIGGVVGDGLRGGYEDWDTPSDIAAYVSSVTRTETNSESLMPPILPFMASVYDAMGSKYFAENVAIRGDGTLMYANKEGFGKGLSWRNGTVLKNTSIGKIVYKTSSRIPALSIGIGTVDVALNTRQYGLDSRQTYGAFGGAVGGILGSIGTGFLVGGPAGAVVGLAVGIGASYGGEWLGKKTFDWTH